MKLFPYPEMRVLEDSAFARGVVPTRIFAVLLPVWSVTIQSDVTEAQDYELIDRYLARGIAEGGLTTTAGLAGFFALEPELVDRALRALSALGHVHCFDGHWTLTELGLRSVRDRKRYVVTTQDRRKLYFDGFASRPLPRPCYDTQKVTLITLDAMPGNGGPRFHALYTTRGFDAGALDALSANPYRDRFNLPERIDNPQPIGRPELVFLPLYVVRGAASRLLVYSQASSEADPDLGDLLGQTPEVAAVLDTEVASSRPQHEEKSAREWLDKQNLGAYRPERLSSGLVRVRLPAREFGKDGALPLSRVGSFMVQGNSFFQLWCDDAGVRRNALLGRVDTLLAARGRFDRDRLGERVTRIARQLDLGAIGVAELRKMAADAGRRGLASQLDRMT